MKTILKSSLVLFSTLLFCSFQAPEISTQQDYIIGNWDKLGTRKVSKGADRDVMVVTARQGRFKKLKIKVTDSRVHIQTIKVVYGNGNSNLVVIDKNFKPGDSKIVDLPGKKRIIKKIIFNYHTKFFALGKAKIHVFGKH